VANLEALWIAGQLKPGSTVVASEQAHYTHSRISAVLRLPFESIESDSKGRMDLQALLRRLEAGGVGTVVVTIGTTATGAVDYLPQILKWRDQFGFRAHADAAYGGYFKLADNLSNETKESFEHLAQVDSIVIDPHKHGLQPYGCGCVIFRDPSVGRFYKHDSPYTYFSSKELHLGEISLECSRAGASAVGLWATQRLLPMVPGGKFAQNLVYCHDSAIDLYRRLDADYRFLTAFPPELDILIWAVRASRVSQASDLARRIFDEAAKLNLHLALAEMPIHFFNIQHTGMVVDAPRITCLRSVLMKPEHKNWVENIWQLLDEATYRASEAG
jgi:glutamate/tyrosine decarboxylase-like PLP-dependent enzyme